MIALWYSIRSICEFVEGRHDEAIDWAQASVRVQPKRSASYLDLAVNNVLCGEMTAAHQAIAELTSLVPTASVDLADRTHPFAQAAHRDRYRNALRQAGLPD